MFYAHKTDLAFRKVEESDLEVLKFLKDESWFGTHQNTLVNSRDQHRWFDSITVNPNALTLMAHDLKGRKAFLQNVAQSAPIGVFKITGIDWKNQTCDVGWDVFWYARGVGFGSLLVQAGVDFTFEVLNLRRVDCEILENNLASSKCALSAGFVHEGVRREAVLKCGDRLNSHVLGILHSDWINLDRVKKMEGICNISYKPKDVK
jgi:RimJ/RimL family protein N-acetyltransferase